MMSHNPNAHIYEINNESHRRCLVHETEHGNFKHTKVSVDQSPPIGQRERGEDC
jgi:hypothetical protein